MKRFFGSLLVIALLLSSLVSPSVLAESPPEAPEQPVRVSTPDSVSFVGTGWFTDKLAPLPGLRWTHNFDDAWALTVQLNTLLAVNILQVGANWYVLGDSLSLYVHAHAGASVVLVDAYVGAVADMGIGMEWVVGHFVLNLELGPAMVVKESGPTFGGMVTLGLGGRF